MNLLLAAATESEISSTLAAIARCSRPGYSIDICITGVGLMAATYALTKALYQKQYNFVVQAGIAGAFDRNIALGGLVVVQTETLGDLGAEDGDEFLDIYNLGFGNKNEFPFTEGVLNNPLTAVPFIIDHIPLVTGLTVHTVSGHEETIAKRQRHFNPDIETMEGAALHYVCLQMGVPFLQLRAISNYVTRRDRSAWKIGEAITELNRKLIEWLITQQ